MYLKTKTFYSIIGIDSKLKAIRFRDIRAIPRDVIMDILDQINAPEDLKAKVHQEITDMHYSGYRVQNHVFDIDRFKVLVIDPF